MWMVAMMPTERGSLTYANRILETVAEELGKDICDLPPLYYSIDPEALEGVLHHPNSDPSRYNRQIQFQYAGFRVTVDQTGSVALESEPTIENKQLIE